MIYSNFEAMVKKAKGSNEPGLVNHKGGYTKNKVVCGGVLWISLQWDILCVKEGVKSGGTDRLRK